MKTILLTFFLLTISAFSQAYVQFLVPSFVTSPDGIRLVIERGTCLPLAGWRSQQVVFTAGGLEGVVSPKQVRLVAANAYARQSELATIERMQIAYDVAGGDATPWPLNERTARMWGAMVCARLEQLARLEHEAFYANNTKRYHALATMEGVLLGKSEDAQKRAAMSAADREQYENRRIAIMESGTRWSDRAETVMSKHQDRLERNTAVENAQEQTAALWQIADVLGWR